MSPVSKPHPRLPAWLMLVVAMVAIGPISINMYLPAFVTIEREFSAAGIEVTMSAYMMGTAISQLFYGPLSDRFGRKPPLYVGYALYALGAVACAFCTNMQMLILARFIQAIGAGAGAVIANAIIRDRCEPTESARIFSKMASIVALSPIFAPFLGGSIVEVFGWRTVFAFQALLGVAVMIAIHSLLNSAKPPASTKPLSVANTAREYWRLIADRRLLGYSLMGGAYMGATFAYTSSAPTVLTHLYGLSPQAFGTLIGLNGIAFIAANQLSIIALRKISPIELLARYFWTPLAIAVILWLLAILWHLPLWLVVIFQVALYVCVGSLSSSMFSLALAPHGNAAGSASALMSTIYSIFPMASGFAVAVFNDRTIQTIAAIMTASSLIALGGYIWAREAESALIARNEPSS